jgi:hypothetical protein
MRFLPLVLFLISRSFGAEWYVDARTGNDFASGERSDAAFQTIGRLRRQTLGPGDVVRLARGSQWREELRDLPEFVTVEAYGEGERPLLDASDAIPPGAWRREGSLFAVDWAHSLQAPNKVRFSVWENGIRMRRAATLEEAGLTPGSFWAPKPDLGTTNVATIYVNPRDGDPARNGHTYEVSSREYGLLLPTGGRAIGIHTRRNGHHDGSLVGEFDVLFRDCVAEDGTMHNVFLNSGLVEDVLALRSEWMPGAGSSSLFVAYAKTSRGRGTIFRRAKAIGGDLSRPGEVGGSVGFFQHGVPGAEPYTFLIYEDCEASNVAVGFSGEAQTILITGGRASKVHHAVSVTASTLLTVSRLKADGLDEQVPMYRAIHGTSPWTIVDQLDAVTKDASGALIWMNGKVEVSRSNLRFEGSTRANAGIRVDEGSLWLLDVTIQGAQPALELGTGVRLESTGSVY